MSDWAHALLREVDSLKGYVEGGGPDGRSGNIVEMWTDLDPALQGQSWCAVCVSWIFGRIGRPLPAIDRGYGYMNCQDAHAWALAHPEWWDTSGRYSLGDAVLYGWNGDGVADHTGIVLSDDGATMLVAEGNTSPDDSGSQSNGGGFYIKRRAHSPLVLGALRFSRLLIDSEADVPLSEADRAAIVKDVVKAVEGLVLATHGDMRVLYRGDGSHHASLLALAAAADLPGARDEKAQHDADVAAGRA